MPLFLGGSIEPNVMFTLDDSGSTHWEMMPQGLKYAYFLFPRPDNIYNNQNFFGDYTNFVTSFVQTNNIYDRWMRSSTINKLYYNPAVTYRPWSNGDGSLMAAATPSCAYHNPVKTSIGCRNLTADNSEQAYWLTYNGTLADLENIGTPRTSDAVNQTRTFWPAFYYNFTGDIASAASKENAANYTRVEIKSANAPFTGSEERSDCADAPSCTYDEEIQNFANWYTYYRSRILLTRAGVGRVFAEQGTDMRVGFAAINKGSVTVDSVSSSGAVVKGVRKFSGSDRSAFFDSLYNYEILTSGTPLRRALDNVGQYFSRTDNNGPWGETPGSNSTTAHLACRQSYNILVTDGYWNGAAAPTSGAANADNVSGPSITGPDNQSYQYTPANPYQGLNPDNSEQNDTLADVAMYYWNRDLRTDLDNLVPTNPADEAFWQHLVNFTLALGVKGTLDPDIDLPSLTDGSKKWPMPSSDAGSANIDDLWHAAVNSRGGFFSSSSPEEFASQLSASLKQIVGQGAGSVAAIATNSAELNVDTYIFQTWFLGQDWRGELLGFKVDENTGEIVDANPATSDLDPTWEAGKLLDSKSALAHNNRNIFTHEAADSDSDGEVGVDFLWDNTHTPPASIQTLIKHGESDTIGERRLGFIRGNQKYEIGNDPAGTFRKRVSVLGDIVNSDPFFVGQLDYGFNVLPGTEGSSYISYRASSAYRDRPGVVYVGVNDGMLHAFREDTGYEMFAYIPEAVLPDLWQLSDPNYSHRFYVDGPSSGKDAYINSTWMSVLLGTTGAGGKSVFALDVTDPENFSKSDVMWEFSTDDDDADADGNPDGDLGYTIGQPTVARMANGTWVAIFGNGYYSTNNRAVLFIVDIATGNLIRKIDTEVGSSSTPNGLATPILVDYNDDKIVDRAYAGDLLGNMWAFDLSHATDITQWDVDYQSSGSPAPLFTAMDEDGNVQAITSKPEVTNHPSGGVMVFFGTGKYFDSGDGAVVRKNAFYGIWDDFNATNPTPVSGGRSSLLQQTITHETYTDSQGNSWLSDGVNNSANPFPWDLRASTETSINWASHKGWYIDLKSPLSFRGWEGERVVSAPLLRDGRVIFQTMIPNLDPCEYGSTHWSMELSAADGSRLDVTPYDLNADDVYNENDYVEIWTLDQNGNPIKTDIPVSGKRLKSVDFQPPQLSVSTPLNGATLNSAEVTFTGSATDCGQGDSGIASVTVNGSATTGGTATGCDSANWTLTLPLSVGTKSFTVTATDASPAGNQAHEYLTLIHLPLIADSDNNGLPDSWEAANSVTDPNAHSDADGINDGDEYRAGTDPNDENSHPEGASGVNYVLLRDHFDDGQYEDRWYLSALDPYTNYSLVEAGTEIEAGVQQPFSDCKALRFQHFATVDVVNMVYHATLEMDGNGMTVLGLMKNQSMDNRIEIALDNDQQPHLTLSSVDAGVLSEIPVSLPESYQGVPLDLRITKAGSDYQVYVNNIHEGSFTNNGLDNLSVRPFVEASSCSTDEDDLASRIDLIELLVDRDADGRADTHEDANADGVVNPGESDPLNPDSDGDGLLDGHDNCVLTHNISQTDSGGVNNSDPDGIGDACQCGDQNADGKVTNTDAVLIQRHILGLSSPFNADLCNVNGDGSCSNTDAVIIKRAVLGLPPGVVQKCVAAVSLP